MPAGNGSPLVSVAVPSYGHAEFLPAAVESVLRQTYRNVELLIFDDGSTDGSWELAQRYAGEDARVRVLAHEGRVNRGPSAALNAALAAARGSYLTILAADDLLPADSVARRVEALEREPRHGFVYGRYELTDAAGRPSGDLGGKPPGLAGGLDGTGDVLQSLILNNFIPGPGPLLRREVFERSGGYDESLFYGDWELWIRLLAHVSAGYVDGPSLAYVRFHGGSTSFGADGEANLGRRLEVMQALDRKGAAIGGRFHEPRVRALVSLQRALYAVQLGDEEQARAAAVRALRVDEGLAADPRALARLLSPWLRLRLPRVEGARRGVAETLAATASVDAAFDAGVSSGSFPFWLARAVDGELPRDSARALSLALVGDELEALRPARPRLRLLLACLAAGVRRPADLRRRQFAKLVLSAAGLWPLVARLRSRPQPALGRSPALRSPPGRRR